MNPHPGRQRSMLLRICQFRHRGGHLLLRREADSPRRKQRSANARGRAHAADAVGLAARSSRLRPERVEAVVIHLDLLGAVGLADDPVSSSTVRPHHVWAAPPRAGSEPIALPM